MRNSELKNILIGKISEIKDKTYLEALNSFLVLNEPQEIYHLSSEQKKKIDKADKEINAGKFLTNEEVFEKLEKKWAKSR